MAATLTKVVNIIESNVNNEQSSLNDLDDAAPAPAAAAASAASTPPRIRSIHGTFMGPGRPMPMPIEELLYAKPTFSERFMRYLMVVIYVCGLCSLGFVLSVYHFFFWDSKMPPVYKPATKKPTFFVKP